MNTYYRRISLLLALLAVITTTNTSYKDTGYKYYSKAKDAGYRAKNTVVRAARNNPKTAIAVGVGVLTVGYLARNRMRDAWNWGKKKYNYGFDRWQTKGQREARMERDNRLEQEKLVEQEEKERKKRKKQRIDKDSKVERFFVQKYKQETENIPTIINQDEE